MRGQVEITDLADRTAASQSRQWDQLSDKDLARLYDEGKAVQIRLRRNADAAREQYITPA